MKPVRQHFAEDPVEGLRRNVWLSPFSEDDLWSLPDLVPIVHLLFGSANPYPEGLSDPLTYVDHLNHLTDDQIRKAMGGNLAALVD